MAALPPGPRAGWRTRPPHPPRSTCSRISSCRMSSGSSVRSACSYARTAAAGSPRSSWARPSWKAASPKVGIDIEGASSVIATAASGSPLPARSVRGRSGRRRRVGSSAAGSRSPPGPRRGRHRLLPAEPPRGRTGGRLIAAERTAKPRGSEARGGDCTAGSPLRGSSRRARRRAVSEDGRPRPAAGSRRAQRTLQRIDRRADRLGVEVDQDVAAGDQVERPAAASAPGRATRLCRLNSTNARSGMARRPARSPPGTK